MSANQVSNQNINCGALNLDISRRIKPDFANADVMQNFIADMFAGKIVNGSENQAATHMALRGATIGDTPAQTMCNTTLAELEKITKTIQAQGRAIRHIIHIGIGGSLLGPKLVLEAIGQNLNYDVHFISNLDPVEMQNAFAACDPKATIVIVASKSFTTSETFVNANVVRDWLRAPKRLYAATANPQAAADFGCILENILPFPKTVGGRFSLWGSVGLVIALACGWDAYSQLLAGAKCVDEHVQSAKPDQNISMILAALSYDVIQKNAQARCVIPYATKLVNLPLYLQQLEMESLGKSVDIYDQKVSPTGLPVFGQVGSDAQHAICQLLHQGTGLIEVDLIGIRDGNKLLNDHFMAQATALQQGTPAGTGPAQTCVGGRPVSVMWLDSLTPYALGQLLAVYEHKTACLAALLGINPFDQHGVQLAKTLLAKKA